MMKHRIVIALVTAAVVGLTACSSGGGTANSPGQTDELNIAWNAQPPSIDPIASTATATRDISQNIFEPLITIDANSEVQPVLAESFELADDGTEVRFVLRDDVQFHDGELLHAEDAVASLKRWIEGTGTGETYFQGAEVTSPEDGVVLVTLAEPLHLAPMLLADQEQPAMIMPARVIEDATEEGVGELIGTGPYAYVDWKADQFIELSRFEEYSSPLGETSGTAGKKSPVFDTIKYHFVSDPSTRMSGLQTGEYDAANALPLDNFDMLAGDPNLNVMPVDRGFIAGVFNKKEGLMTNPAMRQAVLAAANMEEIQRAAFSSDDFYNTNGSLMPLDSPLHSDVGLEVYNNTDQEVVDAFLAEANYNGEQIRILTSREYADHYDSAVMLQQQLETAGMNADLIVVDWPTLLQDRKDPAAYDIFTTGLGHVATPTQYVFMFESWPGWTSDDRLNSAKEAFLQAPDEATKKAAFDELQLAFYAYLPVVKFGDNRTVTGLRADLEGYAHLSLSGDIFYNVYPKQ